MIYRGHVENGMIRLNDAPPLPEGAEVEVRLVGDGVPPEQQAEIPTLYERLQDIVGKAEGLPRDLAENHDHYLHGQPKR